MDCTNWIYLQPMNFPKYDQGTYSINEEAWSLMSGPCGNVVEPVTCEDQPHEPKGLMGTLSDTGTCPVHSDGRRAIELSRGTLNAIMILHQARVIQWHAVGLAMDGKRRSWHRRPPAVINTELEEREGGRNIVMPQGTNEEAKIEHLPLGPRPVCLISVFSLRTVLGRQKDLLKTFKIRGILGNLETSYLRRTSIFIHLSSYTVIR